MQVSDTMIADPIQAKVQFIYFSLVCRLKKIRKFWIVLLLYDVRLASLVPENKETVSMVTAKLIRKELRNIFMRAFSFLFV